MKEKDITEDYLIEPEIDHSQKLINKFHEEEQKWKEKIDNMSRVFSNFRKLEDIQVIIYSERQVLIEYRSKISTSKIKVEAKISKAKKEAYEIFKSSNLLLKTYNDIKIFIDAELADQVKHFKLLEMHVDYINETLRTLDGIIYGIKNKIDHESMYFK